MNCVSNELSNNFFYRTYKNKENTRMHACTGSKVLDYKSLRPTCLKSLSYLCSLTEPPKQSSTVNSGHAPTGIHSWGDNTKYLQRFEHTFTLGRDRFQIGQTRNTFDDNQMSWMGVGSFMLIQAWQCRPLAPAISHAAWRFATSKVRQQSLSCWQTVE